MSPRLMLVGAGCVAVLAVAAGLYWKGRHDGVGHERPKIVAAQAQAAVARLETDGARQTAQRVEVVVRQREAATAAVSQLTAQALISEDAHAPLDPARAARLRDADRLLCDQAALVGCPTD